VARQSTELENQEKVTAEKQSCTDELACTGDAQWQADWLREVTNRSCRHEPAADLIRLGCHPELLHEILNGSSHGVMHPVWASDVRRELEQHGFEAFATAPQRRVRLTAYRWSMQRTDAVDEASAPSLVPRRFQPRPSDVSRAIAVRPEVCAVSCDDGQVSDSLTIGRCLFVLGFACLLSFAILGLLDVFRGGCASC